MSSSPRASMIVTPWSPIGPDTRTASPGRTCAAPSVRRPFEHADAGGGDVAAVGLAALDDLGVAGDDLHAGRPRPRRHRRDDPPQVGDREALLEDEAGRQVQRPRAGHRQVVDRAVDGEVADVAAGEEQRRDDVGVGGERQPRAVRPSSDARRPRAARAAGCGTPRGTPPRSGCGVALPPAPCASVIRSSREPGPAAPARSMRSRTCSSREAGSTWRARVTAAVGLSGTLRLSVQSRVASAHAVPR